MPKAMFYTKLTDKKLRCDLCPHYCSLDLQETGICRVRTNKLGKMVNTGYGQTVTVHVDPIEKKPLYHFYQGVDILSLGGNSCNLACEFCQNYSISQLATKTKYLSPDELVKIALKNSLRMVAFTYTEPFTWYEYVLDTAKILNEENIAVVLISNGFINPQPLKHLLPYVQAFNIDIKSMSNQFYQERLQGALIPVLKTVETIAESDAHLEITNLVIPTLNDNRVEIEALTDFIVQLDVNIPLHFSRYHPQYKLEIEATPFLTLTQCYNIAKKKLNYVYIGNVNSEKHSSTYCPNCDELLIKRNDYKSKIMAIEKGTCRKCGEVIQGVWKQ